MMKKRNCSKLKRWCVAILFSSWVASLSAEVDLPVQISAENPAVVYSGRRVETGGNVRLSYSGARIRVAFVGEAIGMKMTSAAPNWVNVFVDGKRMPKIKVQGDGTTYELASGLSKGTHTVEIVKATEALVGSLVFEGFSLPSGGKVLPWPKKQTRAIEFIGDSITCGFGIEVDDRTAPFSPDTENFSDTYAGITARELDADFLVVARSGIGIFRNYDGPEDGSPDNMPAIYERAIFEDPSSSWNKSLFTPDVVCINLGTNDFSGPGADGAKFGAAYKTFLKKLMARYPTAKFVLLTGPMENSDKMKRLLQEIVKTANGGRAARVSFLALTPSGRLGFGASYHPSRQQAEVNGRELTQFLSNLMNWPVVKSVAP